MENMEIGSNICKKLDLICAKQKDLICQLEAALTTEQEWERMEQEIADLNAEVDKIKEHLKIA